MNLAQQRQSLQENIADDRNDVNIYRINMASCLQGVTKLISYDIIWIWIQ